MNKMVFILQCSYSGKRQNNYVHVQLITYTFISAMNNLNLVTITLMWHLKLTLFSSPESVLTLLLCLEWQLDVMQDLVGFATVT
jgi:hypothetical protein